MIGIVGGAGPLAGVDIVKKIIEETRARKDQDHVPVLLLSVPASTPDRTQYLIGAESDNPAYPIAALFQRLEQGGAQVGAIPCNTAHADAIFGVVQQELKQAGSQLKLIHMIQENVAFIQRYYPGKRVGVLSTKGTRLVGIYREAFQAGSIPLVEPDADWQERIHAAIYDTDYGIKAFSSPVSAHAVAELEAAMQHLIEAQGAEVLVLGCTELPLAIPGSSYQGIPLVDPNRILARALIREIAPEKLKPM